MDEGHESETHSCEWHYEDEWFPGTVELAPIRPPDGQLFGWLLPREAMMSFPQQRSKDVMWGRLRNNEDIALINATLQIWLPDRALVSARAAIVGLNLRSDETLRFPVSDVQITALPALIGTVPLAAYHFPSPGKSDPLDGSYRVDGNPEACLDWTSPIGHAVCRYDLNVGGWDGFRWHVDTIPIVGIRPPEPMPLMDYMDVWITPLLQIATFLTGGRQQVTNVTMLRQSRGESEDDRRPHHRFKVFGSGLGQGRYTADRPDGSEAMPMYTFKELPYDLPLLVDRWRNLTSSNPQALKPYLNTLFINDLPARASFLYMAQALEAIHRSMEGAAVYAKHAETRKAVLTRVKELGLERPLRTFLNERIDRHGGPSLKNRIKDLVGGLPENVQNHESVGLLSARVPEMRNDLAHGLREYEPEELEPLIHAMKLVADARLLASLELAPEHALRLVKSH